MAIRTTQTAAAVRFLTQSQALYSRMAKTQEQLNTGLRITRPSDDPSGTSRVIDYDAEMSDVARYRDNVASSMAQLASADTALGSMGDAMGEIRRLALQAANGTYSSTDLQGIASSVLQLKEAVRDGANAQFGGQYLFGGTSTLGAPFPAGSNAYAGTANAMARRVGENLSIDVTVSGEAVLGVALPGGPAPGNAFDVIDQLAADIAAGNGAAIRAGVGDLDGAIDRALNVRVQLGTTGARLELLRDRLAATAERLEDARSQVAEVDAAEVYMRFNQQQTAYNAALAAGTRMLRTSILDFI